MTYRVRNIAVAVALALLAGMLSLFYVSNYKRHVQSNEKTVSVYVAKRDIPVGTSGADIIKKHLLVSSLGDRSRGPRFEGHGSHFRPAHLARPAPRRVEKFEDRAVPRRAGGFDQAGDLRFA